MRCKHKWKVLSEVTTQSQFEHAMGIANQFDISKIKIPHQMCSAERKFIQTVTCEECGKIKQFVKNI